MAINVFYFQKNNASLPWKCFSPSMCQNVVIMKTTGWQLNHSQKYIEREGGEIDRYQQRASIDSISTFSEKMNKACKKNDFPNF